MINGVDSPKPKFIARVAAFYGDVVKGARRSAILARVPSRRCDRGDETGHEGVSVFGDAEHGAANRQ
jgi:hypothetical protein